MKRYKYTPIFFILLFSILFSGLKIDGLQAKEKRNWPNCPAVLSDSAIVMDINTGTVLVEKRATEKKFPASITKVMTVLIALENAGSLDERVLITREAIEECRDRESSSIGMIAGEELSLKDCLYAIMLASANEVANAVAIHIGGSMEEFVDMMNEKAEELGCVNTRFNNPNGLHDDEHYTCAVDMAKIGREAIKHEMFKKVAGTRSYVIPKTELMNEERPIANHHQMINPAKYPQYAYENCYAGKTGYTLEAGMTLISFAKKGTMDLVCVVLKAGTREAQFGGTAKLFDYCFKRFRMEQAEKIKLDYKDSEIYKRILEHQPEVMFYIPTVARLVIPKRGDIHKIEPNIYFNPIEELMQGENEIGRVEYRYNEKVIGTYPLMYKAGAEFSLVEKEKKDIDELKTSVQMGGSDEEVWMYKLSILVGGALIVLALLVAFFYIKKNRERHYYTHKSLRKKYRKKNRLW